MYLAMMRKSVFIGGLILFLVSVAAGVSLFFSRTRLRVDGQTYSHYALHKGSVQELLDLFAVRLSSQDIVEPALSHRLRWGENVRIIRVREVLEEKEEVINFVLDWRRRTSKNLRKVEIQKGQRRKKVWIIKTIFQDGKEVEQKKILKQSLKTPVTRLILLNKKNRAEKIYDLSRAKKMQMIATAYWEGDPQVPDIYTYLDHRVEIGLVAVDPAVIPLRSRLYIPGYGYAYASDTGSAIKGRRIDLFVESKEASRQWEYKKVDVYVLEKAKTW